MAGETLEKSEQFSIVRWEYLVQIYAGWCCFIKSGRCTWLVGWGGGALTQVDIGAAAYFKTKPLPLGAICSQLLSCICICADFSITM